MKRRTFVLMAAIATVGCDGAGEETRPGTNRQDLSAGPGLYGNPALASDGRLAYDKFVEGKNAIFVADGDGRSARRVSFGTWDVSPVWSTDGKWIAFIRDANSGDVLVLPADSGAERVVAVTPAAESPIAWLPDGSGLLYFKDTPTGGETWIHRLSDGSNERFLDVDGSAWGLPSPDGKLIGYTLTKAGATTVWLLDRATNTHRQLTTEGFERAGPKSFSPDGRSLLFESTRSGTKDLWRVDLASGNLTQLTRDIADDFDGRWAPDGMRILFSSNRGGQSDIWMLRTGESDVVRVTDDAFLEWGTNWTADGTGIVLMGLPGFIRLEAFPVDGGGPTVLTTGDWNVHLNSGVAVSHDGKRVAYSGLKNGDPDIYVVPVSGGESHLVSSAPGDDVEPTWSLDGHEIAFTSVRSGSRDLWVAPVAGGEARRLTDWPTYEQSPRWSPDGTTLLFDSNRDSRGNDLWTMPSSGGTPKRLTTLGTVDCAQWSPDSRQVIFCARTAASEGNGVFVVPAAGGTPSLVVPGGAFSPRWSPDGREIAVGRNTGGYSPVEVYSLAGALLRRLSFEQAVYEFPAGWSPDGSQLLINLQDLRGDGSQGLALHPAAGGSRRALAPGNAFWASFADSGKVAVAIIFPSNRSLVRIKVP